MPITPAVQTYCWDLSRHADLACPFYSALIIQLANFQAPDFIEKFAEPKQSLSRWQKAKRLVAFGQTWIFGIPELALNWVLKIKTCSSHSHQ